MVRASGQPIPGVVRLWHTGSIELAQVASGVERTADPVGSRTSSTGLGNQFWPEIRCWTHHLRQVEGWRRRSGRNAGRIPGIDHDRKTACGLDRHDQHYQHSDVGRVGCNDVPRTLLRLQRRKARAPRWWSRAPSPVCRPLRGIGSRAGRAGPFLSAAYRTIAFSRQRLGQALAPTALRPSSCACRAVPRYLYFVPGSYRMTCCPYWRQFAPPR